MKSKLFITVILLFGFACTVSLTAQQKLDKKPFPVGGIKAIMQNVEYPDAAKEEGISGAVFVKAVIDTDGKVISTEVIKSAGELLDGAAETAILKTLFVPGEKDGQKVKAEVTIPVKFRLK